MADFPSLFRNNSFSEQAYDLPCLLLASRNSRALIACQGAQVTSWLDKNGKERLYLSPLTLGITIQDAQSIHDAKSLSGPAIRGGIPVCFPQFSDRGPLVKHGFVRNRLWTLERNSDTEENNEQAGKTVALSFKDDEETRAAWPHAFQALVEISVDDDSLTTRLSVTNTDSTPISFTAALHTYLQVNDIRKTQLLGLEGIHYQDAADNNRECIQQNRPINIEHEVDRVYRNAPGALQLIESGAASLDIRQEGFVDTVVWNPGPDKARALKDFPDDDWLKMLCVEAACVMQPIVLQPGQTWTGSQILSLP